MRNSDLTKSNILPATDAAQPACRLVASTMQHADEQSPPAGRLVRVLGRPDTLTAQRVEVGMVLHAMLGMAAAVDYFGKHGVNDAVVQRVLSNQGRRRGTHDANGVRT
jgi:hypothetical protein